jgi:hypothetical protein
MKALELWKESNGPHGVDILNNVGVKCTLASCNGVDRSLESA